MSAEGKVEQGGLKVLNHPEIIAEETRDRLFRSSGKHMEKAAIGWGLTGTIGLASMIFPPAINGLFVTLEEAYRQSILALRDAIKLNKTKNNSNIISPK